jgi:hypothetical protein
MLDIERKDLRFALYMVDAEKAGKRLFQKGTPVNGGALRPPQASCGSPFAAPGRLAATGIVGPAVHFRSKKHRNLPCIFNNINMLYTFSWPTI